MHIAKNDEGTEGMSGISLMNELTQLANSLWELPRGVAWVEATVRLHGTCEECCARGQARLGVWPGLRKEIKQNYDLSSRRRALDYFREGLSRMRQVLCNGSMRSHGCVLSVDRTEDQAETVSSRGGFFRTS